MFPALLVTVEVVLILATMLTFVSGTIALNRAISLALLVHTIDMLSFRFLS